MEFSKATIEIFSKLEQQWLSHCDTACKKIRILCIDGGGTNADCAGTSLVHLERQIRLCAGDASARISDFFDIFAGSGVGAILAAMLVAADVSGRPMFSACEAVSFLSNKRADLFRPKKTFGFRRRRFSGKSMEKVLKEVFTRIDGKVMTLRDTCKPLLVPCFDLKSSAPFVFSRTGAIDSANFDFDLWKICRASSATPGMFTPFNFTSVDGKTSCSAIDGGIVMNNPAALAVTHVIHNNQDFPTVTSVDDLLVLSLGNGPSSQRYFSPPMNKGKSIGKGMFSTSAVVGIAADGVSEAVDQMLGNAFCWNRSNYLRIQTNGSASEGRNLAGTNEAQRVLRERGIETLPFGGKRLLAENNGERIDRFVERLLVPGRSSLPPSPCKISPITVNPIANGR